MLKNVYRAMLSLAFGLMTVPAAYAQAAWPDAKAITLIVPFSAGGSADAVARLVSQKLGDRLGQAVVVSNIGGGGGVIGTQRAADAAPDGYTLLLAVDSPVAIARTINPQAVRYDPRRDFAPVALLSTQALVLMGRPDLAVSSLQEVIALAKARPGEVSYATSGVGTILHLAMERLQQQLGINLLHVPYRGGAQAITDLLGNQVDLAILTAGSAVPMVASHKVKGLAVTDAQRLPALPDVPSITELPGLADFAMHAWVGIFVPANTPQAVIERLSAEINAVLQMDEVRAMFVEQAIVPGGGSVADFAAFVQREQTRYAEIVRTANIRAE